MENSHEGFMRRCLQLAALGTGNVAPNPMVGAILVYNDKIIGEGYHEKYGESHAEVNCIQSVKADDVHLIKHCFLYVSLEPCDHFGKTPPCTDLIIRNKISKVIIGCQDSFTKVNGKGIKNLKKNGIEVILGILDKECRELNKRFFLFHSLKRPYIILKWAQTNNNKISSGNTERLFISNKFSNKLVHKWRSEEAGILIGTNTAKLDNPVLTNRFWKNKNSIRLVVDLNLRLKQDLKVFNSDAPTIVFSQNENYYNFPIINIMLSNEDSLKHSLFENKNYHWQVKNAGNVLNEIMNACYQLNIQSILVEGGAQLLQSLINENLYDEVRIVTNKELIVEDGLNAPMVLHKNKIQHYQLMDDEIEIFRNS